MRSAGSGYNKDWNTEIKNLELSPHCASRSYSFYLGNGFLQFFLEQQLRA